MIDIPAIVLGLILGYGLYSLYHFITNRHKPDRRSEVRYERMGDDPIDMQWANRRVFMDQRQCKLDASQGVMGRLI